MLTYVDFKRNVSFGAAGPSAQGGYQPVERGLDSRRRTGEAQPEIALAAGAEGGAGRQPDRSLVDQAARQGLRVGLAIDREKRVEAGAWPADAQPRQLRQAIEHAVAVDPAHRAQIADEGLALAQRHDAGALREIGRARGVELVDLLE